MLSVLDVSKRELYLSADDRAAIPYLCMPGAHALASKIKECLSDRTGSVVTISGAAHSTAPRKPVYTASLAQRAKTRTAHDAMTRHIASIADMAVAHQQKLIERRRKVVELADRMARDPKAAAAATGSPRQRVSSFGADDHEGSGEDDSGDETVHQFRQLTLSGAHVNNSSGTHALNISNHSTSSTGSRTTTAASTTQSSVAAAFSKVLRPRAPSDQDVDNNSSSTSADRATTHQQGRKSILGRPAGLNSLTVPPGAAGSGSGAGTPSSSRLIAMSKQSFKGYNKEEFLDKFLRTQVGDDSIRIFGDSRNFSFNVLAQHLFTVSRTRHTS